MSDTGCNRLISVLAFYVFSCSCFHSSQTSKPSREARNESQLLWREEIESGPIPSFVRNNTSRQSSRGSSHVNTKPSRGISTPSSSKTTSQFYLSVVPGAELRPLEDLVWHAEKQKNQRITTVTVAELPKIHPPINDRHPPVVSALPGSRIATAWMTLPPPPARVMRAINRATHIHKTSQRRSINDLPLDARFAGPAAASTMVDRSATVVPREIGSQEQDDGWKRHHPTDPEASDTVYTAIAPNPTKEQLRDILFPTYRIRPDTKYERPFPDPASVGTKTDRLSYDEEAPASAATCVEVIRRPPQTLKSHFSVPLGLDGFDDIYG